MTAQDLEHSRGIAVTGLSQDGEDVRTLEADVTQEMVVQFAEGGNVPTDLSHASEMEEEGDEAGHLRIFLYF
nr:hypothetical protein [Microvirga soli]